MSLTRERWPERELILSPHAALRLKCLAEVSVFCVPHPRQSARPKYRLLISQPLQATPLKCLAEV